MRPLIRSAALALLLAPAVLAQPSHFGHAFPLTNTRYAMSDSAGSTKLVTNGREFFLFWSTGLTIRMTRLTDGERRNGRPIMPFQRGTVYYRDIDVVWTGSHFVVVAVEDRLIQNETEAHYEPSIVSRAIDERGEPLGEPFTIVDRAQSPRLACNGSVILLAYLDGYPPTMQSGSRAATLTLAGQPNGSPSTPLNAGFIESMASDGIGFAAVLAAWPSVRIALFDSAGRMTSTVNVASSNPARAAVAGGPSGYLVTWCQTGRCDAATLSSTGVVGRRLSLDQWATNFAYPIPASTWNGSGWTITYTRDLNSGAFSMVVIELDAAARNVLSREETAATVAPSSIAAVSARVRGAYTPYNHAVLIGDLPRKGGQPDPMTYAATDQTLLATATAADATLVAWKESGEGRNAIRAGLRTRSGDWIELEIASDATNAVAASDGRDFIVVTNDIAPKNTAVGLSASGQRLWSTTLPFDTSDLAWNGRNYAAAMWKNGEIAAALISPQGTASTPVIVRDGKDAPFSPVIASDGENFLVAWAAPLCFFPICPNPSTFDGVRLGAALQPLDGTLLHFAAGETNVGANDLTWDGAQYAATWAGNAGIMIARVPSSGSTQPVKSLLYAPPMGSWIVDATAARTSDGLGIVWREDAAGFAKDVTRVAFLSQGSVRGTFAFPGDVYDTARLAQLPDGRTALVTSAIQEPAPHHVTRHVMMAIGDVAPLGVPDPPRASVTSRGVAFIIEWTEPPQFVNGYRIEYRVGDGTWNELNRWLAADEHSTIVVPASQTERHAFRVRAWSDGGTSAYSNEVYVHAGRRRSVR